jgi:hypothetical protein
LNRTRNIESYDPYHPYHPYKEVQTSSIVQTSYYQSVGKGADATCSPSIIIAITIIIIAAVAAEAYFIIIKRREKVNTIYEHFGK